VALGATVVATASAAPAGPLARAAELRDSAAAVQTRTIVVRRRALAHGLYAVRLTISDSSAAAPLSVAVSDARAKLVTLKDKRAVLTTHAWSRDHAIVVRVRGQITGRPRLRLSLHRLDSRVLVVHKSVGGPGTYVVKVTISGTSTATNDVSLKIGKTTTDLVKVRRHAAATVTADIKATGSYGQPRSGHLHFDSVLTVRASGSRARPQMTVELAQVKTPAPAPAPTPASTAAVSSGTPVPTGVGGNWHLIFDDEFNGTSLNAADWSTGWFGSGITGGISGGSEPECYDPSHVVEGNDELELNFTQETESCAGTTLPYTSGMITTNGKFSFTYGMIEFKAWLPTASNGQVADWPDLWTDGQNWPTDGEIDVAEGLYGSVCAHYHGPTDNGQGIGAGGITGCPSGNFTGGWHTFAADWEPGIVTWYYDGQDIGCLETTGTACGATNSTIAGAPMYVILSLGSTNAYTITAPTSLRVAYVRVWQH
jgi:beta-glucanase (GH16 family)